MGNFTSFEKLNENSGGSSKYLIKEYISQVPCTLLKNIYLIYKEDFDLFEYDIQDYLSICNKQSE